jgi:hypothetical protein
MLYLLMKCPRLTMIGVDLWEPQPGNTGPENYTNWPHRRYEQVVREEAKRFGDRAIILKTTTHEASLVVPDESLDFAYIDADHAEAAVRRDIHDWWPKVKPTGWIAGHDINWPGVRKAVEELVPGYILGPNDVWARAKMPASATPPLANTGGSK